MELTEDNGPAPLDLNNLGVSHMEDATVALAVELEVLKRKMRDLEKELKEVREIAEEAIRVAKRAKRTATFGR